MTLVRSFPPISRPDAETLILGSMPGRESLARQQYYAHPRNAFWPIMSAILELPECGYTERSRLLQDNRIAVWDVLMACVREGSLDANIEPGSIVANDFASFYARHPAIARVFFNGAKAESVYRRHVLPGLAGIAADLSLARLPSTSPAHAAMSLAQKKRAWSIILE
jgi:TDG/mug DNA glycosylase family protein